MTSTSVSKSVDGGAGLCSRFKYRRDQRLLTLYGQCWVPSGDELFLISAIGNLVFKTTGEIRSHSICINIAEGCYAQLMPTSAIGT